MRIVGALLGLFIRRRMPLCAWIQILTLFATNLLNAGTACGKHTELEIRAAYLYQFTKFIEWPPESLPEKGPLNFCIWEDARFASVLEGVLLNRQSGQHPLSVRDVHSVGDLAGCQVVYLSDSNPFRAEELRQFLTGEEGRRCFSISADERVAPLDCLAYFLYDGNRIAFAFQPAPLAQSKLKVSSKLLRLAHPR